MQEPVPTNLIIRYLSNQATTEEVDALLEWVAQNDAHLKILTEWMEVWGTRGNDKTAFNLSAGISRLNARINQLEPQVVNVPQSFPWMRVAASLLILIAASVALIIGWRYTQDTSVRYTEYVGELDKISTILLADGSRITIHGSSTLKYPEEFTGNVREVILEGEAFFDVKRDSLHPFIVHTGELHTEVLGTSFNIRMLPDNTTVTVATGKVKVSDENGSAVLLPNEKVIYSISDKSITKQQASLDDDLTWKYPVLIFQDTPLADVAKSIEKHYGVVVSFETESLKHCVITGKFKNQSLTKVLEAIGFSTGVQFRQFNNQYILHGKGCEK